MAEVKYKINFNVNTERYKVTVSDGTRVQLPPPEQITGIWDEYCPGYSLEVMSDISKPVKEFFLKIEPNTDREARKDFIADLFAESEVV